MADLMNFDAQNATAADALKWAQSVYSDPHKDQYLGAWKNNSSGQGNLPNVYRQQVYNAYANAKEGLGREVDANTFAQLLPLYKGSQNYDQGNAYIASLAQQEKTNPNNPNSNLNPNNPSNTLSQYSQPVKDQFQAVLGRDPTSEELQHFSSLLGTGQTDAYGLQSFLKAQPEYQTTQDTAFRNSLDSQMQASDAQAFNRMGAPQVMSQYAQTMGGAGSSPSLDYAMTDLMGRMTQNRQSYLQNLTAQQYQGNKGLALQDYGQQQNQYYQNQANNQSTQNQLMDSYRQNTQNFQDYNTQAMNYGQNQQDAGRWSPNTFDWLNFGVNTADNTIAAFTSGKKSG